MAFVTPTTASGQVLTSSIWNVSVRDNLTYLYTYGPNRARAEVTHNATQSIANNSPAALVFSVENADAFALHSASGSRLTVPSGYDGWWLVSGAATFASNATGVRSLSVYLNGSAVMASTTITALNGLDHAISVATLVRLTATNYVELFAYQNSGGALNVLTEPYFRAVWLAEV